VVVDGATRVKLGRILADAAYDSENHHRLCREFLGIRSSVIRLNSRGSRFWPTGRFRRQLKRRFPWRVYAQRVHVESAFSQHKRLLGSVMRSRTQKAREQEILLHVIVHNLMLLRRGDWVFYRAA